MKIYRSIEAERGKDFFGNRETSRVELVGIDERVVEVLEELRRVLHQDVSSFEFGGKDVVKVEVDYWSNTTTYYTTIYIFLLKDNIQLSTVVENPEEYEEFKLWELYVNKINSSG